MTTQDSNYLSIASLINTLARICHQDAVAKGFHDDYQTVEDVLNRHAPNSAINWFHSTTQQAEIARMHSELSEGLESIRKNPDAPDHHLPQFPNIVVEYADCIIRILDTCGKNKYPIGDAFVAKWEYNKSREFKHGKNS